MKIVAFSGSRDFPIQYSGLVYNILNNIYNEINNNNNDIFIHIGDCPTGIDKIVRFYLKLYNKEHKIFKADWNLYGLKAGPYRNQEMIQNSNKLVAIRTNINSKGTNSAINIAKKLNIELDSYILDNDKLKHII